MSAEPEQQSPYSDIPWVFILAFAGLLICFRFWYHFAASPLPDEAYYWQWGQRPALSYFDHPPLQAWTQWLATASFGTNRFSLRIPAVVTSAIIIVCLLWWVRLIRPSYGKKESLGVLVLVFSSPLWFSFTGMVFNDHVMLALLCVATITVFKLFRSLQNGESPDLKMLYLSAVLIGLAGLAKYNAVFFALGIFGAVLWNRPYRRLLRSRHLYGAVILCLACLSPVLIWNLQNQSASFQYNLNDRLGGASSGSDYAQRIMGFAVPFALSFSPFLFVQTLGLFRPRQKQTGDLAILASLALPVFFIASIAIFVLARFTFVIFYWNIVAIIALMPLLALTIRRRWAVVGHVVFGTVLLGILMFNHTIFPLSALGGKADDESAIMFGWSEISETVQTVKQQNDADFQVTSDYRSGSILSFWTKDPHVEVIAKRASQFSLWFDPEFHAGQTAVILTSGWFPITPLIRKNFETVEKQQVINVSRFGYPIAKYTIFLGRNYRDPSAITTP